MESLSGLAPVRAGRFFVYGRHDKDKIPAGAIPVEIDASLAFGTGHHGTTEGCLLALDEVLTARRFTDVLDLGCGTALLAIAVAKALGVAVLASDIDPEAVRVARENANLNGVGDLVRCETAAGFDHPVFERNKPFDLILANILAGPLIDMASDMAAHMAPGGIAILSGLLIEQSAQVEASYHANGFRVISRLHRGDWAILTLRAE
ncbi:MAG: 50S ribosomal protein L11 methyltransferase [Fimbriimonadaceae bacterium]|nr:50S ribosomal protein L11 methyltransferase [Alphaproteobacteria bacterium]